MNILSLRKKKYIRSQKKRSLFSFWLWTWLPLFFIAAVAIVVGTAIAHSYVCDQFAIKFENTISALHLNRDWEHGTDYAEKKYQEERKKGKEEAQAYARFQLEYVINQFLIHDIYGILMNEEKEPLATTSQCIYFRHSKLEKTEDTKEWKNIWYQCKDVDIVEELQEIMKNYSKTGNDSYAFVFDSVYIKGMEFLPETLCILDGENVIDTITFSLERKDLSGYGYLKQLLNLTTNRNMLSKYSSLSMFGYEDWDQEYLNFFTSTAHKTNYEELSFYKYASSQFEGRLLEKITVEDQTYYVMLGAMYEPMDALFPYVMFAYIAGFLFTASFALAISSKFYNIYQAEYVLQERQRNFSDALAHDLKTPLMAISGYTENLLEQIHPEKQEHYLKEIQSNVSYMNDLVGQVLELAKWNHTVKLEKETVNLRDLVEQVISIHKNLAEEKQLSVHVAGESSILASPEYLQRAIANLYTNALTFSPEHHFIYFKLEPTYMEITNTGVEISQEDLEELWKPFVKGDKNRSEKRGHGLGLSIVKEIMDLHDFSCEITSGKDCVTVKLYF